MKNLSRAQHDRVRRILNMIRAGTRSGEYPNALDFCERYTVVAGIHPPNRRELMEKYADAFEKVFSQLDTVMDHADDDIVAHYTGRLFRAE